MSKDGVPSLLLYAVKCVIFFFSIKTFQNTTVIQNGIMEGHACCL